MDIVLLMYEMNLTFLKTIPRHIPTAIVRIIFNIIPFPVKMRCQKYSKFAGYIINFAKFAPPRKKIKTKMKTKIQINHLSIWTKRKNT